ncbi:hypothetical protein DFP79_3561 [Marinomonas balearica]|uniref:IS5 family transposase n=1 Tax=Marinomonas balearica TaxID=491947 RepID=A0A4R6M495_9GAMM|nr:hypothetical protein DFP79_3561 [Marinomonas balearica]
MDQLSFSDAEHNCKRKQTKRERFLLEMDKVIPWKRLEGLISPHYPNFTTLNGVVFFALFFVSHFHGLFKQYLNEGRDLSF